MNLGIRPTNFVEFRRQLHILKKYKMVIYIYIYIYMYVEM